MSLELLLMFIIGFAIGYIISYTYTSNGDED